jgi:hypothetical protein
VRDNAAHALAAVGALAILAGLICIAVSLLRLGFVAELLPLPIRYGFLNGIILTAVVGQEVGASRRDTNGGTAAAMAMARLPQAVKNGRNLVGLSGATYNGQSALALGLSRVSSSGRRVCNGTATTNTRGVNGIAIGAGMHW